MGRPDLSFETRHHAEGRACVGVDEVGRGCLAGPVVAAAVALPERVFEAPRDSWWWELNDSKLLTPAKRERLAALLREHARVGIAWCMPVEIDRINILRASLAAMRGALEPFLVDAPIVLVDGHINPFDPRYACAGPPAASYAVETLVKGDRRSLSIAAASIVAKVYRDRWMTELDVEYPGYGFARHKGYTTPEHYAALRKLGPCALHRRSFRLGAD